MTRRRASSRQAEPTAQAPSLFDAPLVSETLYEDVGETFPGASPGSAIAVSTLTQTAKDIGDDTSAPRISSPDKLIYPEKKIAPGHSSNMALFGQTDD